MKADEIQISDKTNEELRDEILLLNNKQLLNISQMAYYDIISSSKNLLDVIRDNEFWREMNCEREHKILLQYMEILMESIKNSINPISSNERDKEIEKLLKIRQDLYELGTIIEGYDIELSYIGEIVDQYSMKILSKTQYKGTELNDESTNINMLIGTIEKTLSEYRKDYKQFIELVSNIIRMIPMRMTKESYFSIIKSTLMRNFTNYSKSYIENQVNEYKKLFDSSLRDSYGTKFDSFFTQIQKLKNIELKSKTLEELESIVGDIIIIARNIAELHSLIIGLGLLVNRIIVVYLTVDLFDNLKEIEEIIYNWEDYLREKDENIINNMKSILALQAQNIEKELNATLNSYELIKREALKREGFYNEDLNKELLFTGKVLTYYNDIMFTDHKLLFSNDDQSITLNYLEQSIDSLIQYVNRTLSNMDNMERKIRMRRLLSVLELPFNGIEDFLIYIKNGLDERVISKEEIYFTINYILYSLEELRQ
jgi:hypothetical protein